MSTHGAALPGGSGPGQDRWAVTPHGVIVLDGATTSEPGTPPADQYVDALLAALSDRLDPITALTDVIADAIRSVADQLDLQPGRAPSSTVALLRLRAEHVDIAVLGDSTAVLGHRDGRQERVSDPRIETVAAPYRQQLVERLRAGNGYDPTHRQILAEIQTHERKARNSADGYWIAEADPEAGHHAITHTYDRPDLRWAVLATDGAQRAIDHRAIPWPSIAEQDAPQLRALLADLHRWETATDPNGRTLPWSKPHDDKTLVLARSPLTRHDSGWAGDRRS